jgi:hypothetical protein
MNWINCVMDDNLYTILLLSNTAKLYFIWNKTRK